MFVSLFANNPCQKLQDMIFIRNKKRKEEIGGQGLKGWSNIKKYKVKGESEVIYYNTYWATIKETWPPVSVGRLEQQAEKL